MPDPSVKKRIGNQRPGLNDKIKKVFRQLKPLHKHVRTQPQQKSQQPVQDKNGHIDCDKFFRNAEAGKLISQVSCIHLIPAILVELVPFPVPHHDKSEKCPANMREMRDATSENGVSRNPGKQIEAYKDRDKIFGFDRHR